MSGRPPRCPTRGGARIRGRARVLAQAAGAWLGAALGSGAVACGGAVDSGALARAIEGELRAQGLQAAVTCPVSDTEAAGELVSCTAVAVHDPARTELIVRARIGDAGRVTLQPQAALAVARAAPAIRRALADEGIEARTIDCDGAVARPGEPLRCEIEARGGQTFRWQAVVGADGHARGELVAR